MLNPGPTVMESSMEHLKIGTWPGLDYRKLHKSWVSTIDLDCYKFENIGHEFQLYFQKHSLNIN